MYGTPDPKQLKLQHALEYGPLSPRTRMTLAAYLIENDEGPSQLGADEFISNLSQLVDYVTSGSDELNGIIDELTAESEPKEKDAEPIKGNADDEDDIYSGYTYL